MRVLVPIKDYESCCFPHLLVDHNMPCHTAFSAVILLSPSPQSLAKKTTLPVPWPGCATTTHCRDGRVGFAATQRGVQGSLPSSGALCSCFPAKSEVCTELPWQSLKHSMKKRRETFCPVLTVCTEKDYKTWDSLRRGRCLSSHGIFLFASRL